MSKAEQARINTQSVIELLENQFKAYNVEDADGGRISFEIETKLDIQRGEFHRRDYEVMMVNNIRMGSGFSQERYDIRDQAITLEDSINESITTLLK
jgi:hypothetical protein